jgi:galactokinase
MARFGSAPDGVAFAPGRVNLIGEHVDYNDGLVLPMPISVGTAVAWKGRPGSEVEAVALDFDAADDRFDMTAPGKPESPDWSAYLRGMSAAMRGRGLPAGAAQLAIAGSLPRGSGLSSSASLCVAVGRALAAADGGKPPARELALAAQQAEHDWAGVRCGIMDQMVIAAGTPGAALLLDCLDLSSSVIPLPDDWAVMIVQSGVRRELADGQYNARRAACDTAAEVLDVASLRDASEDMVAVAELEDEVRARARHVVTEITRVRRAVECVAARDLAGFGACLAESHASLRDDFAVSVPPVDALVAILQKAIGAAGGARMTGAGFGGAVVAVLARDAVAEVRAELELHYRCPDGRQAEIMIETCDARCAGDLL